ncbi:hypothetical protein HQ520_17490, partial [bacterium]|nr:hypothetical protein [bacterium]
MKKASFIWLDANRFDRCQHRTRSVAMMRHLTRLGLPITYVTSFDEKPEACPGFHYLPVRTRLKGIFRLAFMIEALRYIREFLRGRESVVLLTFPQTLHIALIAKMWAGLRGKRVHIHLDFRTVPVFVSRGRVTVAMKYAVEYVLFWKTPILLNRFFVSSNSFITERMRREVGGASQPFCVWTSGVEAE